MIKKGIIGALLLTFVFSSLVFAQQQFRKWEKTPIPADRFEMIVPTTSTTIRITIDPRELERELDVIRPVPTPILRGNLTVDISCFYEEVRVPALISVKEFVEDEEGRISMFPGREQKQWSADGRATFYLIRGKSYYIVAKNRATAPPPPPAPGEPGEIVWGEMEAELHGTDGSIGGRPAGRHSIRNLEHSTAVGLLLRGGTLNR